MMAETVLSSVEHLPVDCMVLPMQTTSVDAARHILLSRRGKPENLPPTSDTLSFHVKRSH